MVKSRNFRSWSAWWGIELSEVSTKEKFVSILGGFLSILVLLSITSPAWGHAPMVVASMGASAVLLFAVPHGQLSQPWPVIAGHALSAAMGVACGQWISCPQLAGACSVALAIGLMHQFKCIHPPGGATALTAVLGGPAVHAMGYKFVAFPVIANASVMVAVAVIYNVVFSWRKYPASLNQKETKQFSINEAPTHEEIVSALRSLDSFVDITEDDLLRLLQILTRCSDTSKQ
jgi:CBS-domain-containing membrane protein